VEDSGNTLISRTIISALLGFAGVQMDALLSTLAYSMNPEFFYKYEVERTFANFLHYGDFPSLFFLSSFSILLLFFPHLFFIHSKKHPYKQKQSATSLFFLMMVGISFTRISAGLTWFGVSHLQLNVIRLTTIIIIIFYALTIVKYPLPIKKVISSILE